MNQTISADRLESLKAGVLGAIAAGVVQVITTLAHRFTAFHQIEDWVNLPNSLTNQAGLVRLGIALLTGFLFGITYRYIVRQDPNPQIKTGAVIAFALVRGLAQVDVEVPLQNFLLLVGIRIPESLLMFAAAYLLLDWCMKQGWIRACS